MEYLIRVSILTIVILSGSLFLSGCHVGYTFQGPGFDSEKGSLITDKKTQVLVAITHGVVQSDGKKAFSNNLHTVRESLAQSPGLIGYSVRKQVCGNRVWTMSAWTTEEALKSFISSSAHRAAVENGGIPPAAVRSAYFWTSSERLPISWEEAQQYLESQ